MSEDTNVQEEQSTQVQQAEISTIEDQAREQGWVPKDDYTGDEHKWVEAGEFLRRGELFKKIDQVSRSAKRAEQTLADFKKHYAKVKETEYVHALATLKAERSVARADGDFERADKLDDQMETVKAEAVAVKQEILQTTEVPEVHPEVQEWVEKNSWYNKDLPMKAYADSVAMQLNQKGIIGNALLKQLDEAVREAFPAKFKNPNRERVGSSESPSNKGSRSSGGFELNDQEQRIMNAFVRDGVMTKEEYITDLKKVKGIK